MAQHQAPFVKPAIYPLGLEIGLKLQAITSHLQQKSHAVDLQLKKTPSMLLTLSALRCRLPAAIFNESLPTHICIHLMDFVRVCMCVSLQ